MITPVLAVPRDWSDLTPMWLGAALGRTVARARVTDVVDGTNSRAVVELEYVGPAGPPRVFVKREGRWLNRLALTALGAREAEADLVARGPALPLEHPAFHAAATDRRRLAAVVVMEDVTLRGGRPNSALAPLTVEQVAAGLGELARLHARFWDAPLPSFVRPWRLGPAWAPVARAGFVHALRKLRRAGHPLGLGAAELERGFRGWARIAAAGPQTLLHGDPHPGNTYTVGATVGFYDWQLVRSGSWVHDVGYFLASSLTVADRRAHERALLAGYLDALGRRPADAWRLYRRTPVFGLGSWLQTWAAGTFQPPDICLATIERFAAAHHDARRDPG
ncbi:ecdysteroid 22-kinase family protein [Pseudonocardia kujensis]|uniref:ecdysteroid 22-kinase family protein n=1 Tax=Pseudonocardia kujensis TaxID=1128675 RepID=UPI001E6595D2|nr:ecdysteroid 22-kinase family protein [Pseudonocardia kujensis]MCE0768502.1 ecdysteroid 22-kinase family protein [Pseudonocardia kujensis]